MSMNKIDELATRLTDALPEGLKKTHGTVKQTFLSILKSSFEKMDFVTREEFDAQTKILARAQQKLEQLEKLIAETARHCE